MFGDITVDSVFGLCRGHSFSRFRTLDPLRGYGESGAQRAPHGTDSVYIYTPSKRIYTPRSCPV